MRTELAITLTEQGRNEVRMELMRCDDVPMWGWMCPDGVRNAPDIVRTLTGREYGTVEEAIQAGADVVRDLEMASQWREKSKCAA